MATNKQKFWTPGNIIVTRGDLQPEYYIIRDDGLAYPCNKTIDKWWLNLYESNYDDDLNSIRPENIRKYWDIIEVYTPIDAKLDMSVWTSGSIGETNGGLFYSFSEKRADGLNNDGSFLEKETYNDDLSCNLKNRKSWDFIKVYKKDNSFNK